MWKTLFVYTENRLPHQLSKLVLRKQTFWVEDWCKLWPLEQDTNWLYCRLSKDVWIKKITFQLTSLRAKMWTEAKTNANASSHGLYKELMKEPDYLEKLQKVRQASWIFKSRCGLLGLNTMIEVNSSSELCGLCCLEDETIDHFFGRCHAFLDLRRHYFGCDTLTKDEIIQILNGLNHSWKQLAEYSMECFRLKQTILAGNP